VLLIYSVLTDEQSTDEDFNMLIYYAASSIATGYLQIKLHKGVIENYYNKYRTWTSEQEESAIENEETDIGLPVFPGGILL
jgi:hypothetical protein